MCLGNELKETYILKIEKSHIPLIAIIFFVMLNALYNSLSVAYGLNNFPYSTFLFYSNDLHADLVKMAMGYWHNVHIDTSHWDPIYQKFYELYHSGFFVKHHFNNNHLPPLPFLIGIFLGKILQSSSPGLIVSVYYLIVFLTIFTIATYLKKNRHDFYILTIGMLLSYPVLMVLTRGNIFSFFTSFSIIAFLFLIYQKRFPWIAVLLLSFAIEFRPNIALLSILFFVYPYKSALRYIVASAVVSLGSFFILTAISHTICPQYSLESFIAGLHNYINIYITGNMGVLFNNSLYGAIRSLSIAWHIPISTTSLLSINTIIAITGILSLFIILYLYLQKKINTYEFIFFTVSITTLSTTIFATYHLTIFLFFVLIGFKKNSYELSKYYNLIVFTTIFLLVPKNYIFFDFIYKDFLSAETILNPVVLLLSSIVLLMQISKEYKYAKK